MCPSTSIAPPPTLRTLRLPMTFPFLSNAVKSSVLGWGISVAVRSNLMSSVRGANVSRSTRSVPCPLPVFASEP